MKNYHDLKHKIIFYVMTAAILVTILVTTIMFKGSVRSTDAVQLDNMQIAEDIHLVLNHMMMFILSGMRGC